MALKNLEEAIVERIQRSLAKELKRLRRGTRATGNGHSTSRALIREAETMARDALQQQSPAAQL